MFFELGGYHDLGTGMKSEYTFTNFSYLDERYQPLPEPIVTKGNDVLQGKNYGLIFGLGNSKLLASKNLEFRAQYYLGLSKSVPLGSYSYISQSVLDLSLNLYL